MRDAGGAVRVADLADGAGCSHRHLVARFREQIGATPKTAARVLRYAWAARLLARRDLAPAQAAVLCGYADQPHMTREFAALAGTTRCGRCNRGPRRWRRTVGQVDPPVSFLQDLARAQAYGSLITTKTQRIMTVLVYADIAGPVVRCGAWCQRG
jgi:AraC-like DNA-binding protein